MGRIADAEIISASAILPACWRLCFGVVFDATIGREQSSRHA
ncbi:hypothetical protein M2418_001445 [Rhizobium sp. BIGb0125]|nr:hypothetical protein [Rhizobium sp. BIGb0125]MCS4241934.1 hypothetical protein [Rhizobium sp. BIGb0125]